MFKNDMNDANTKSKNLMSKEHVLWGMLLPALLGCQVGAEEVPLETSGAVALEPKVTVEPIEPVFDFEASDDATLPSGYGVEPSSETSEPSSTTETVAEVGSETVVALTEPPAEGVVAEAPPVSTSAPVAPQVVAPVVPQAQVTTYQSYQSRPVSQLVVQTEVEQNAEPDAEPDVEPAEVEKPVGNLKELSVSDKEKPVGLLTYFRQLLPHTSMRVRHVGVGVGVLTLLGLVVGGLYYFSKRIFK